MVLASSRVWSARSFRSTASAVFATLMAASRLAAQVLQVLQPLTALLVVATQLSHTLFSFHPPLMATAFILLIGQGVLTSLAARGLEGDQRGQLLQRHALW